MFGRRVLAMAFAGSAAACASVPDVLDRPGLEYAGCYMLSARGWPPIPNDIEAPDPIYLNGPDTLELQARLGYGPGIIVLDDGEGGRLTDDEARRRYDQSRPLTVYPDVSAAMHSDNATWKLVTDDHLTAQWTMAFQEVGRGRNGVRVELELHLDPRTEPLSGWAERGFYEGAWRGSEVGHMRTDTVPLVATRIECPPEFPYFPYVIPSER